ncbi:MAG: glycosyltransferase family 87 protein [Bacteroidota bacterium]|nr:glycosyltransferase family 87 protein [Bacteroidota bacterium]
MKLIKFPINFNTICVMVFFLLGLVIIIITINNPIGDFGNYYYGSKIFKDGNFTIENYKSIDHFNRQILGYGETNFFENYIPVPPFSILFYLPLVFLKSITAKLIFNLVTLILFCFSLAKTLKTLKVNSWALLWLPIVFFGPLYNNILQGQSYLLIAALLMEAFIASEKNKPFLAAILIGLCMCLKIFPGIILVYFLLKRQYKICLLTLLVCLVLMIGTAFLVHNDIVTYYCSKILPRLFNNDIIGSYYYSNQSIYSVLLNLFSFDGLVNRQPVLNSSILVVIIESISIAFVFSVLILSRKKDSFVFFGLCVFGIILIGRYNTTYAMLLLVPFFLGLIKQKLLSRNELIIILCLITAVNIPMTHIGTFSFFLKYTKLWLLIIGFMFFVFKDRIQFNLRILLATFIIVFALRYFSFSIKRANYYSIQNKTGVLYDYGINADSLVIYSTLGSKNIKEVFKYDGIIKDDKNIELKNNIIYYKNMLVCASSDNKLKAKLYNDTSIIFMSDLNQGIAFYKLRLIRIK